jgi:hypothetical protein
VFVFVIVAVTVTNSIVYIELQIKQAAELERQRREDELEKKNHLDELERQKLAAVNATVEQARVQGRTQAESEANLKTAQQFQELLTQSDKRNEMQSKLSLINNQTIAHSMLQGIALSTSSYFIKFIFIVVCLFDMYQLSALTAQKS